MMAHHVLKAPDIIWPSPSIYDLPALAVGYIDVPPPKLGAFEARADESLMSQSATPASLAL